MKYHFDSTAPVFQTEYSGQSDKYLLLCKTLAME